jgi:hypothetical protein
MKQVATEALIKKCRKFNGCTLPPVEGLLINPD